jgi:hypothetical protein
MVDSLILAVQFEKGDSFRHVAAGRGISRATPLGIKMQFR